jgi:hypothetical protein
VLNRSVFLIVFLIGALFSPLLISSVSCSSGNILLNSKTSSTGQQMQAGGNVNLYFASISWTSTTFVLFLSQDGLPQISSGDFVYTPRFSIYDLIDSSAHTYNLDGNVWMVGNNWINGSIPSTLSVGNYFVKAFDENLNSVAVSNLYLIVNSIHYNSTLNISPPSGAGGVDVVFSGSQYPAGSDVTVSYYDPALYTWNLLTTTTANASGQIQVSSQVPDLKKTLGNGDFIETSYAISYKAEVSGIAYSYASYNQYLRGLKTVGNQTANGLYGNGTSLISTVRAMVGDTISVSGKWFHPGIIYLRWDSTNIVGTVTNDQWSNAFIVGSTVANSNGTFSSTITIPSAAAGEHYIAIEDSQTRITIKIFVCMATLNLSPASGPGGATVQFTGDRYPPSTQVDLYYKDPSFGTWNYWTSAPSDATGKISLSVQIPDLLKAQNSGDNNGSSSISFRSQISGVQYSYVDYCEFSRGLSQVGTQIAHTLFGNGTSFTSIVNVNPSDSLTIAGKWFHPGIVYIRFDGASVVGTVTSDQWKNAQVIGTTTASSSGSFSTVVTIPTSYGGDHYLSIEDSQTHLITKITVLGPAGPTSTPTPAPTNIPTSTPIPTRNPNLPTPAIDLSCKGIAITNGYNVNINGNLQLNNNSLTDTSVLILFSVTGGDSWLNLTLVKTQSDGSFGAVWTPNVNGNYLVRASVVATPTFNAVSKTVTLALTPDTEKNVFTLNSNSTITQFAFNSTHKELSFIASGPSGTNGYVEIYIPKTLINDISNLKTYVDGTQVSFNSESRGDSWLITFNYSHSQHTITMELANDEQTQLISPTAQSSSNIILIAIVAVIICLAAAVIVAFKRQQK